MLKEIELVPSSIINNLTITIFSYYISMTPRYRLQQPRKILESKLINYIKNSSKDDKKNKNRFLSIDYDLITT